MTTGLVTTISPGLDNIQRREVSFKHLFPAHPDIADPFTCALIHQTRCCKEQHDAPQTPGLPTEDKRFVSASQTPQLCGDAGDLMGSDKQQVASNARNVESAATELSHSARNVLRRAWYAAG